MERGTSESANAKAIQHIRIGKIVILGRMWLALDLWQRQVRLLIRLCGELEMATAVLIPVLICAHTSHPMLKRLKCSSEGVYETL